MLATKWRMAFTLSVAGVSVLVGREGSKSPHAAIAMSIITAHVLAGSEAFFLTEVLFIVDTGDESQIVFFLNTIHL
jgi:hypothetical protein